ncbi:gag-pol polyprotein [Lasius niger]|uniref:RNA-directed DNA polymerase n=1 Tax=Lasius niger TaxID=67767 RepID=A0A0J7N0P4_LASNI|nr:gag-pol polyprotein [Lasius niger]
MPLESSSTRGEEATTGELAQDRQLNPDTQRTTGGPHSSARTFPEPTEMVFARATMDEAWINSTQRVRLPQPLWREMPTHWFNVVEATFALNRITSDETKFRHILSNLDPTIIPFVTDLITDPPHQDKYEAIKKGIISAFGESKEAKLRKLLRGQELGEDKPSHLLRRLRNLAGGDGTDSIIRSLFLEQLPESARSILAVSPESDLDILAMQANKIMEAIKPQVALVRAGSQQPDTSNMPIGIQAQVNEIRNMVEKLSTEFIRGRSQSESKPRYRNKSRNQSFGKLDRPRQEEATASGPAKHLRLLLTDKKTGANFLVDTGSDVSVLPKSFSKRRNNATNLSLFAANGSRIKTYGDLELELNLGLRRSFRWKFIIADVSTPILGADFFFHFNLLVDLRNRRFIDGLTRLKVEATVTNKQAQSIYILKQQQHTVYSKILTEFSEITRPTFKKVNKHSVKHYILTKGHPLTDRARRLSPEKLKIAKKEIDNWIRRGDCQPGSGQWASAMHLVPKKDGGWRICGDYRRLNELTIPDRYPILHLQDFAHKLHGCTVFSTIDLARAYHQIPMATQDKEKTALITPFGLFEFNVMPFGLKNAAQTFQRFMDTVLRGLEFCFCYLDDILVASRTESEHQDHLRQVLRRIKEHGLSINAEKCNLGQSEVKYLGCTITKNGTKPIQAKVEAILRIKKPKTIDELRRVLGMNQKAEQAFKDCKKQLAEATLLAHPMENAPLILSTDASDFAIGAALEQYINGQSQPLGFFSKKLTQAQTKYSAYDRELLAVYKAIKFFIYMAKGRDLTVRTDHKPLTYALAQKPDKASPRQLRQLSFISQFVNHMEHIAGQDNVAADTLSRIEAIDMPVIVSTQEIAQEQRNDAELQILLQGHSALTLKKLRLDDSKTTIYCDVTSQIRIYIPVSLRRRVIETFHNTSHPGIKATRKTIAQRFIWPSINKDVADWVRTCLPCQRAKIQRHNQRIPEHISIPDERFQHVHLDIVGPLPMVKGNKYCLTMIDRYTRWPEAAPIADTSADTIATVFFTTWVARFGAPALITTDRGSQFESLIFEALTKLIGSRRIRTTAYHPQSNGMIERWHPSLKTAIKCQETKNWIEALPVVLLGLRTSYKEDIKASTAEMVYGTTLKLPGEYFAAEEPTGCPQMFTEKFREYMRATIAVPTAHHIKKKPFIHKELESSTHVFVRVDRSRGPLEQPYEGPFPVITKINDTVFRINYKGQPTTINVDRLKPAFIEATEPQGQGNAEESEPQPGPSNADLDTSYIPRKSTKAVRFAT